MDAKEQVAFYQTRPPACLEHVAAKPINPPPFELDGHGEPVNTYFGLTCRHCGSAGHTLICHHDRMER